MARDPVNWDDQPLGLLPDRRLAEHLGRTLSSVRAARIVRGIPPYGSSLTEVKRELTYMLAGELLTLRELAAIAGVSESHMASRLRRCRAVRDEEVPRAALVPAKRPPHLHHGFRAWPTVSVKQQESPDDD